MSDWIFPDGEFALPQRWGGEDGKAQERAMSSSVGGNSGIRQASWRNPDGTWTDFHSRGGFPLFEKEEPVLTSPVRVLRGFVARCSSLTVLFDPYTLEILQSPYVPSGALYEVQPFATTWNVPSTDDTHWCDVVLFDGSTIKVNALAMPALGITAAGSDGCIPHVRNIGDRYDQYGNQERNLTEKRVFAVGREHVQSWGGDGVTETLTPTAPRSENKAMTSGQRVEAETNTAYLGQLFYSGESWDDFGGEWGFSTAQIAMLLTPPYLTKTSGGDVAAMPVLPIEDAGTSSGTMDTSTTMPATPVAMTATGYVVSISPYYAGAVGGAGGAVLHWDWAATVSRELEGRVHANYTRLSYAGDDTQTVTQAGVTLTYLASNVKNWDNRSEITYINDQTVQLVDTHIDTISSASLGATPPSTLYWSTNTSYNTPESVPPSRGQTERLVFGYISWSSGVPRDYETQTATFSVSSGSGEILYCEYYREHSIGQKEVFHPNTTYYDIYIGDYSYSGPSGMGLNGLVSLGPVVHPGSDLIEIASYYKINPTPPPIQTAEAVAEINQEYSDMANAIAAQTYYDSENPYFTHYFYSRTIDTDVTEDVRRLTWRTKDYLLYDVENGVFISVEGNFSGSGHPATATLGVSLKVQTRFYTNVIALGEWSYTYGELLPEKILDEDLGLYAVPSPQIRAMFAPLYQEQGSFKGAHYVTAAEEANGALPAHLFNFILSLQMYGGFSTCNDDNQGEQVFFVPCNLLEMLYAFVFSQEYGVSQYERYPVTFPARYDDLAENLFKTYRVCIRDGVSGHWIDTLGADFAARATTSLHRT